MSRESVSKLYVNEAENLRRHLVRRGGQSHDAEDIVQETYIRLIRSRADEDSLRNPKAFLFTIASNLAIDSARKMQRDDRWCDRTTPLDGDHVDMACPRPGPEEDAETQGYVELMLHSLNALPVKCRTAFLMNKCLDKPQAEVAGALGVSISMVEKYISQALRHLRNANIK